MKINKLLPISTIVCATAAVAPIVTSCANTSIKKVWEKTTTTATYEGYTQKCTDTDKKIKVGEIADKYFGFQKDVREAINDDLIRTGSLSLGPEIATFTVETSSFDRDTLRLTSKLDIAGKSAEGENLNYQLSFENVPMEFLHDGSNILLVPMGIFTDASSLAIWQLPNWNIHFAYGNEVDQTFSPDSSKEDIGLFYEDYTAYLAIIIEYFDGIEIE